MKKILFFIESLSGGGAEKVLSEIVTHLNSQKYDITVYTVTDNGIYQKQIETSCTYRSFLHTNDYNAGGLRRICYWIMLKLIYRLPVQIVYKYFIREKYDIEIAFVEGFSTKFIAASSNKNSKKIAWVHTDVLKNTYADKYYESMNSNLTVYNSYNQIICVSQSVKESFQNKFSISRKITVQYNPLDNERILADSKKNIDIEIPNTKILLGTIGRLEKQKGYRRLIECAHILFQKGYDFTIWIIGEGSQRIELDKIM